jgi:hypothetical protein
MINFNNKEKETMDMTTIQQEERLALIKKIAENNPNKGKPVEFTASSIRLRLSSVLASMKDGYQL